MTSIAARLRAARWRRAAVAQDREALQSFRLARDARRRGDLQAVREHTESALSCCARGIDLRYRAADEMER